MESLPSELLAYSSRFFKVSVNNRKKIINCGSGYNSFIEEVSKKFDIPSERIIVETDDQTEVDEEYYNILLNSYEDLTLKARLKDNFNDTEIKYSSDVLVPANSPASSFTSNSSTTSLFLSQVPLTPQSTVSSMPCQSVVSVTPHSMDIWQKLPDKVIKALDDQEILDKRLKSSLVNVMWDFLKAHTGNKNVSRKEMRQLSSNIVEKYPHSFTKHIEGVKVSDGVEELMLCVENKRDNDNRLQEPKKRKSEEKVTATDDSLQKDLKSNMPIKEIKKKYPNFLEPYNFFSYLSKITSLDIMSNLISSNNQVRRIFDYLKSLDKYSELDEFGASGEACEVSWAYPILCIYFKEKVEELIITKKDESRQIEMPCTPFILAHGESVMKAKKYTVYIDREELLDIETLSKAVMVHFASFFIFNIVFPKGAVNTLDCFQRFILKYNPVKPKKRKVNDSVIQLATEISRYESLKDLGF